MKSIIRLIFWRFDLGPHCLSVYPLGIYSMDFRITTAVISAVHVFYIFSDNATQMHNTKQISELGRAKRIWYLSHMRAAKVQASLRIRAVSPEPPLLAHTSSESRGTFRQKARSLAPLNGWACVVKICHDGMLEDTNSLDGAQLMLTMPNVAVFLILVRSTADIV